MAVVKRSFRLVVEDPDVAGTKPSRYTTASQLREEEERLIRRERRTTYFTYAAIVTSLVMARRPTRQDYS